jgi:hypothetical protein
MLTITISARTGALLIIAAAATLLSLYATDARGSGGVPDQVILGDINCDGLVDEQDALGALLYTQDLPVDQNEPCFAPASVAAIPGPQGPAGTQGEQGDPGTPGVSGLEVVEESFNTSGTATGITASCPAGKQALGGGVQSDLDPADATVLGSRPDVDSGNGDSLGWFGHIRNQNPAGGWQITVYAICAFVAD